MVIRQSRSWSGLDKAEELQAAVSSIFVPLRLVVPADVPFWADVDHAGAGPASVTRIRRSPGSVRRDLGAISSSDPDLFKVILHRHGSMSVEQDGRRYVTAPGDLVVFDTARPYKLVGSSLLEVAVFTAPRSIFGAGAESIGRRTAVPLPSDTGLRSVVTAFLSGLADHIEEIPGAADLRLTDALTSLILATFNASTAEQAETPTSLTDRILSYATANIADSALSAESVARHHGISARYLYKLLQQRDISFAAWLRRKRLDHIRRDLLDPALSRLTVAGIAARWGVTDPTHLARAFRAEYGHTPADVRRSATEPYRQRPGQSRWPMAGR